MYTRLLEPPGRQSFFLFGPRGVGKTAWLRTRFPDALFFDLLDADPYTRLLAAPTRLGDEIPAGYRGYTGSRRRHDAGIEIIPAQEALRRLAELIR